MSKTALEIRNAIKNAEDILLKAGWDLVDTIDGLADDDIEQIRKVAGFAKVRANMIIDTSYEKIAKESVDVVESAIDDLVNKGLQ